MFLIVISLACVFLRIRLHPWKISSDRDVFYSPSRTKDSGNLSFLFLLPTESEQERNSPNGHDKATV